MLTVIAARNAKPCEKAYKLAAGGGLYLEVMPDWRALLALEIPLRRQREAARTRRVP